MFKKLMIILVTGIMVGFSTYYSVMAEETGTEVFLIDDKNSEDEVNDSEKTLDEVEFIVNIEDSGIEVTNEDTVVNVLNESSTDIASGKGSGTLEWRIDDEGCLYVTGEGSIDRYKSGYTELPAWTKYRDNIKTARISAVVYGDANRMFWGCSNLTSLDLSGFDTSNVTNMLQMFYDCKNLTVLDLSGFDTSRVTNMSSMFGNCNNLTSLNLSGFNTSNVTQMERIFGSCKNLTSLDLSGFDTSNVTTMHLMFYGCNGLANLDLSGFDTSKVAYMSYMFCGCSNLTSLDLSGFDTSNVTNMSNMFENCINLINLDLSGFDTSKVTNMSRMFRNCYELKNIYLHTMDAASATDMTYLFKSCRSLENMNFNIINAKKVTNMSYIFADCFHLKRLDLSGFDTSNVTTMEYAFGGLLDIESLDVSKFNTSNVSTMKGMFWACKKLKKIDLSKFDTSKVDVMYEMFGECMSLKSLDLKSFNTAKVRNLGCNERMFVSCENLKYIRSPYMIGASLPLPENAKWYTLTDINLTQISEPNVVYYREDYVFESEDIEKKYRKTDGMTYMAMADMAYKNNLNSLSIINKYLSKKTISKIKDVKSEYGVDWKELYTQVFGKESTYGWKIAHDSTLTIMKDKYEKEGFYAVLFINDSLNEAVIAYRGSQNMANSAAHNDWADNFSYQLSNSFSKQMKSALEYSKYVMTKQEFKKYNFVATGHSLGGGLALTTSVTYNIPAYPFDSSATLDVTYYHNVPISFKGIDKWLYNDSACIGDVFVGRFDTMKNHTAYTSKYLSVNPLDYHHREYIIHKNDLGNYIFTDPVYSFKYKPESKYNKTVRRTLESKLGNFLTLLFSRDTSSAYSDFYVNPQRQGALSLGTTCDDNMRDITQMTTVFYGGDGNDVIQGGIGDDYLHGNSGFDDLDGGIGNDTYFYDIKENTYDRNKTKSYFVDYIWDRQGNDKLYITGIDEFNKIRVDTSKSRVSIYYENEAIVAIDKKRLPLSSFEIILDNGKNEKTIDLRTWNEWKSTNDIKFAGSVDLKVYDADGDCVLTITNDNQTITSTEYGVFKTIYNEETKEYEKIASLFDQSYTVKAVGTDSGKMKFESTIFDPINVNSTRIYSADDITVKKDTEYELVDNRQRDDKIEPEKYIELITDNQFVNKTINIEYQEIILPEKINIRCEKSKIEAGSTITLIAEVLPDNSSNTEIEWETQNPVVAKVDKSTGVVTGISSGKTIIYATAQNGITGKYEIEVTGNVLEPYSSEENSEIEKGNTISLFSDTENSDIFYTIDGSDPLKNGIKYVEPIVIDKNCILQAVSKDENGDYSKTVSFTYTVYETKDLVFKFDKRIVSINEIDTIEIDTLPNGFNKDDVVWTTSNESIATVEKGVVCPKEKGEVIISASVEGDGKKYNDECEIIVTDEEYKTISFDIGIDEYQINDKRIINDCELGMLPSIEYNDMYIKEWYYEKEGERILVNEDTLVNEEYTLHPVWEKLLDIVFYSDGEIVGKTKVKRGNSISCIEIAKENYEFIGWKDEKSENISELVVTKDTNLYAQWEKKKEAEEEIVDSDYSVMFDPCGGIVYAEKIDIAVGSQYGKLPIPIRKGFDFEGWFTEIDGGVQRNDESVFDGSSDEMLYAHWKKSEFTKYGKLKIKNIPTNLMYTGMAVKPEIEVYYGEKKLVLGNDYSIKYKNNTKAALDSAKQPPTIIINGKGNLTKSANITFNICQVKLDECNYEKSINVTRNSKAVPIVVYNGMLLKSSDYDMYYVASDGTETKLSSNYKWSENGIIRLKGKANYTGSIDIEVNVTSDKFSKFSVKTDTEIINFDGTEKLPKITITKSDDKDKKPLVENQDYIIYKSNDMSSAGNHKYVIAGIGNFSGMTIVKNFTINPMMIESFEVEAEDSGIIYKKTGAVPEEIVVKYTNEDNKEVILDEGIDYTIKYANNKKATMFAKNPVYANYTVSFIGNYKGNKQIKKGYTIEKKSIANSKVIILDKTNCSESGLFKQIPLIDVDGYKLASSDYIVTYYTDEQYSKLMDNSNKVQIISGNYANVYVKIKGNGNYDGEVRTCFRVYKKLDKNNSIIDLSKARITVVDSKNVNYSGDSIEPQVNVTLGNDEISSEYFSAYYITNINKGTATVMVTGDGEHAIGSKIQTFNINALDISKLIDKKM